VKNKRGEMWCTGKDISANCFGPAERNSMKMVQSEAGYRRLWERRNEGMEGRLSKDNNMPSRDESSGQHVYYAIRSSIHTRYNSNGLKNSGYSEIDEQM
jgi:hypothetical protein